MGSSGADVRMAGVALHPPRSTGSGVTEKVLTDLLWLHALPVDALEHVRARMSTDKAEVVFFLNSPNQREAHASALEICRRAIAASGVLTGWTSEVIYRPLPRLHSSTDNETDGQA
jgi:hypothetical protein